MDYNYTVGKYLLLFGNLEKTVDSSILIIWKKYFNDTSIIIIKKIINKMNFSKRLEILKDIIDNIGIMDSYILEWDEFFSSVSILNKFRNTLAHGMYDVENNKFIKLNKEGIIERIDDTILLNKSKELDARYRQLFDPIVVDSLGNEEKFIWISTYSKLKW